MKKQLCLIASAFALFVGTTAYANTPQPEKCPSVNAIKAAGFDLFEELSNDWVAGQKKNNYDTKDSWTFAMGFFKADNKEGAVEVANTAFATLRMKGDGVPSSLPGSEMWFCQYTNDSGIEAVAYTPAFVYNQSAAMSLLK